MEGCNLYSRRCGAIKQGAHHCRQQHEEVEVDEHALQGGQLKCFCGDGEGRFLFWDRWCLSHNRIVVPSVCVCGKEKNESLLMGDAVLFI